MNNWLEGVKKIPVHLFGFGVPFGFLVHFGGWSGLAVLIAWRAYEEYLDWKEKRDTLAKTLIDFGSQIALTVAALF
jgi:hypothetical protein